MSRYRPPRPNSSPHITAAGYQRLQNELTFLWKEKRPQVTKKVSEAAAQGDRSENAEYIYGKRQLREIDGRIQFLSKRLDQLQVIDKLPREQDRVYFGATVTLEDQTRQQHKYRIVGADEFDREENYISIDAPLSRALIGKSIGDEISISKQTHTGVPRILERKEEPQDTQSMTHYVITNITYQ